MPSNKSYATFAATYFIFPVCVHLHFVIAQKNRFLLMTMQTLTHSQSMLLMLICNNFIFISDFLTAICCRDAEKEQATEREN